MKILYISSCSDCPHGLFDTTASKSEDYWWEEYENGKPCGCDKQEIAMTKEQFDYHIPVWCPLEDVEI